MLTDIPILPCKFQTPPQREETTIDGAKCT